MQILQGGEGQKRTTWLRIEMPFKVHGSSAKLKMKSHKIPVEDSKETQDVQFTNTTNLIREVLVNYSVPYNYILTK